MVEVPTLNVMSGLVLAGLLCIVLAMIGAMLFRRGRVRGRRMGAVWTLIVLAPIILYGLGRVTLTPDPSASRISGNPR